VPPSRAVPPGMRTIADSSPATQAVGTDSGAETAQIVAPVPAAINARAAVARLRAKEIIALAAAPETDRHRW
jgi:hypothetical protein